MDANQPEREALERRVEHLEAQVATQQQRLDAIVRISANLGRHSDLRQAMREMVVEVSTLLHADRTTIYELREDEMLYGLAVQAERSLEVGIPLSEGIAGLVAARGRSINLKDAYKHPAFNPRFDKMTGYRTRSMLCVPMQNPQGDTIGVLQVLNKREGYFTLEDQRVLTALAAQAAITLEALRLKLKLQISNIELRELSGELQDKVSELELLYEIEQRLNDAQNLEELADKALSLTARIARCEDALLYLHKELGPSYLRGAREGDELKTLCIAQPEEGLLGLVMAQDGPLTYNPERHRQVLFGDTHHLCEDGVFAPIMDGERVIGALGLLRRSERERRSNEADERLAVLVAGQLSRAVIRLVRLDDERRRDRLVTIGQMLNGVLHDLRGPMTIINGYAQLMAEVDEEEEREEMAEGINRQITLLNDMTKEIMAFARGERAVFARKVKLPGFVRAVRESLSSEFEEHGVRLIIDCQTEEPVLFDDTKMMRVVTNIARNARQAMGETGTFKWTIRAEEELIFEFEDDGPGIPDKIKDQLFEPFITEGKANGTGLGLAIARRIVEAHRGQIFVENKAEGGARFVVRLPLSGA